VASAFGREIPKLRLDRILEPDWLERPEPESKGLDDQNNSAHGTVALAIRPEAGSFPVHDFQHHHDRSSLSIYHRRACHGETNNYRKRPQRTQAKSLLSDKLQPQSPNIDTSDAREMHLGVDLDEFWHKIT